MTTLNGCLLTEEEEQACVDLVKKLRERKAFTVDFSGYVQVKAKTREEANDIFWNWVEDLKDKSLDSWYDFAIQSPYFEKEDIEEE